MLWERFTMRIRSPWCGVALKVAYQEVAFRAPLGAVQRPWGPCPTQPLQGNGLALVLVHPAFSVSVVQTLLGFGTGKWCEGRGFRQCLGVSTKIRV